MNSKINSLLHGEMENYIFPFFWQHGESEAVLRKYMQVIYDANIRAVCIESRPHPDFVGAGWWRDMDIILEEARKRKMKVWILDDSHFPTGYCNGKIEEKYLSIVRQAVREDRYEIERNENREENLKLSWQYMLPEEEIKKIIYSLTPLDFSEAVKNRKKRFANEILYVFGKNVNLIERDTRKRN